ncbi:MAG: histidine kinase [Giesbergeria sp.]|nr:histidine kinase [Giesbergeria sp.]
MLAVRQSWLECSMYVRALEVILLVTGVLLGWVMWPGLVRAFHWKPRRHPRPSPEVVAERRRIARDLHDGIGSRLVATMAMLDAGNPKERRTLQDLELCMLGMRLAVDAMETASEPLADRLAGLRSRIQPALERRGVQMQWNVQDSEDMALPADAAATEIFHILQEALSNVLQHSGATQVTVTMAPLPGQGAWRFEVCDNGVGWPAAPDAGGTGHGQGVKGMYERARRAGLHLVCDAPAGGGARVCVEAPGQRIA